MDSFVVVGPAVNNPVVDEPVADASAVDEPDTPVDRRVERELLVHAA